MEDIANERRFYERFEKQTKAFFCFHYDLKTKIDVQGTLQEKVGSPVEKYPAVSKDVSAEGLSFRSLHKLAQGDLLKLDMYLTEDKDPIYLEGEVRWSQAAVASCPEGFFDTGIRLLSINGRSVPETIHYDQTYHVIWSDVLDVIFGNICRIARKSRGTLGSLPKSRETSSPG